MPISRLLTILPGLPINSWAKIPQQQNTSTKPGAWLFSTVTTLLHSIHTELRRDGPQNVQELHEILEPLLEDETGE